MNTLAIKSFNSNTGGKSFSTFREQNMETSVSLQLTEAGLIPVSAEGTACAGSAEKPDLEKRETIKWEKKKTG